MKKIDPTSVEHGHVPLTRAPLATRARIISIDGNRSVGERLNEVGLHIGDFITVIQHAPFNGPLLVHCNGQEIAIGSNISSKIIVQVGS